MASFHAKTGWKRPRKRRKKKLSFPSVPTRREIENSKKIVKKLKYTIMASFQAKIDWKMSRKRKNKNYRFVPFLHNA